MIFKQEKKDVKMVLDIASKWGYGNLIAMLMRAWMELLKRDGIDEAGAREAVINRTPYSLETYHEFLEEI